MPLNHLNEVIELAAFGAAVFGANASAAEIMRKASAGRPGLSNLDSQTGHTQGRARPVIPKAGKAGKPAKTGQPKRSKLSKGSKRSKRSGLRSRTRRPSRSRKSGRSKIARKAAKATKAAKGEGKSTGSASPAGPTKIRPGFVALYATVCIAGLGAHGLMSPESGPLAIAAAAIFAAIRTGIRLTGIECAENLGPDGTIHSSGTLVMAMLLCAGTATYGLLIWGEAYTGQQPGWIMGIIIAGFSGIWVFQEIGREIGKQEEILRKKIRKRMGQPEEPAKKAKSE